MKRIVYTLAVALLLFGSCHKYEMIKFGDNEGINFLADLRWTTSDYKNPTWTTTASYLTYSVNFGINEEGENKLVDTLEIGVNIMGLVTSYDRKVALTTDGPDENALEVELIPTEKYIVPADTLLNSFKIIIKRPAKRGVEYKTNLIFDYENSDFSAGTDERQVLALSAQDSVSMDLWKVTEWNESFFGTYSNEKVRYLITQYGAKTYETCYSKVAKKNLQQELEAYKQECEADPELPVFKENGEWIEFPPKK